MTIQLFIALASVSGTSLRRVWTSPFPMAAVTEVVHWRNSSPAVTVTTFNAVPGGGSTIGLLAGDFSTGPPNLTTFGSDFNWPNQASAVDFNDTRVILAAGGFLVPGHSTGHVQLINAASGAVHAISSPKAEYFYHCAMLVDMNGDGAPDVLAARAKEPTIKFWEKKHTEVAPTPPPRKKCSPRPTLALSGTPRSSAPLI